MEKSFIYWFLMFFWVIASVYLGGASPAGPARYGTWGWSLLIFLLFALIGLQLFGHPIH